MTQNSKEAHKAGGSFLFLPHWKFWDWDRDRIPPEFPQQVQRKNMREFSRQVAASYNNFVVRYTHGNHPKMHNAIAEAYLGPRFAEWSLDYDSTIEMPNKEKAPCQYHFAFSL